MRTGSPRGFLGKGQIKAQLASSTCEQSDSGNSLSTCHLSRAPFLAWFKMASPPAKKRFESMSDDGTVQTLEELTPKLTKAATKF